MVLTLDDGQAITIYEKQNIIPQIKDYIDSELYDFLEDKFNDADMFRLEIDDLQESLDNANDYIEKLENKIDILENTVSELEDD